MCGAQWYDAKITAAQTLVISDCPGGTMLTMHPRGTGGPPTTVQITERPAQVASKIQWDGRQIVVLIWEENDAAPGVHYLDSTGARRAGKLLLPTPAAGGIPVGMDLATLSVLDNPTLIGAAYTQGGTTNFVRFFPCDP